MIGRYAMREFLNPIMTAGIRVLLTTIAVLISTLDAQEVPLSRFLDGVCRHGIRFSLDSTTDSLLIDRRGHSDGTAEAWLDLSTDIQLAKLTPKLASTHAFFSLHMNGNWNSGVGGSAQTISGIQSSPGIRVAEIWAEETIVSWLQLRTGLIDGNRDFGYIENATSFVNTADGYNPSFYLLPNYNATRPGAELLMNSGRIRLNLAAFTKAQGTGLLLMEEGGAHWQPHNYPGRLAVGTWQSAGASTALDDTTKWGSRGGYVVVEQTLWHEPASGRKAVAAFFQWGAAPEEFSAFVRHAGGGILWNSPFRLGQNDQIGLSVAQGRLSPFSVGKFAQRETVCEAFYRAQVSPRMAISPDLQYVSNPGGAPRNLLAIGARVNISLLPQHE